MFGWIKPGVVCRHKDAGIVNIIYSISDAYTTVEYASYIPYCKRHNWDLIITVERQWEPVSDTPTWIQEGLHIIDNKIAEQHQINAQAIDYILIVSLSSLPAQIVYKENGSNS